MRWIISVFRFQKTIRDNSDLEDLDQQVGTAVYRPVGKALLEGDEDSLSNENRPNTRPSQKL